MGGPGSCASPIDLSSISSPYTFSTIGAANSDTSTTASDMIFTYLLQPGYTITIQQTYNDYDSYHYLHYGGSCPGDTYVSGYDNDFTVVTWSNTLNASVPVYYIQSGYSSYDSGSFTLSWTVRDGSRKVGMAYLFNYFLRAI